MNTGLKKIYFINSAKFDAVDLNLNQSTLLLGDSGVGKSTIMRACLFFYTMDYTILGIDMSSNSKKTFVEWHFELNGSSHIAYEYTTQNGRFLFILSRVEHLRYTFVDITNFEGDIYSIFLDESNRPVIYTKLLDNIRALRLDYFKTNKKEEYKKILCKDEYRYLTNDVKKELKDTRYFLFKSKDDIETFGSYLSKIFLNSKVSDNNIKNILIKQIEGNSDNSLESFISINLESMQDSFTALLKQSEDIKKFKEIIPKIEETSKNQSEFEHLKSLHKDKQKELIEIVDFKEEIQEKNRLEVAKSEEIILNLKDKFTDTKNEFYDKKTNLRVVEKELDKNIKKAKELKDKFEKLNINEIIKENEKKNEYLNQQLDIKNKLELSKSAVSKEDNKLNSLINDTKEEISKRYDEIIEQIDLQIDINKENKLNILREENHKTNQNNQLNNKIQEEKIELSKLNNEKNTYNLEIKSLNSARHENNTTISLNEKIESIKLELNQKETEKAKIQEEINSTDQDMIQLSKDYTLQLNILKDEYEKNISQINNEIVEIDEQLNLDKNNIYGYIHKNNYPHKNKILKTISKDVLFKTFEEEIKVKSYEDDTLYGLEIQTYDIQSKYDSSILENKRRELNLSKKLTTQKYEENCNKEEKQANKKKNELKQLKRNLEDKFRRIISNIDKINKQLSLYNNSLEDEIESIKDENRKKVIVFEMKIESLNEKIIQKEENLQFLQIDYKNKQDEIISWAKNENNKLSIELKELQTKKSSTKNSKDQEIQNSITKLKNDFNELLKKEGIDVQTIEKLEQQNKTLDKKLSNIEKNQEHIYNYNNHKNLIESIDENQKQLIQTKESIKQISDNFNKIEEIYESDSKKEKENLEQIQKLASIYNSFVKKVDNLDIYDINEDIDSKQYSLEKVYSMILKLNSILEEEQNLRTNIESITTIMTKDIKKICRKLDANNRLNLPVISSEDDEDIYMLLNIFSKYLNAYQMGYSSEGDDSVFKNTKDTLSNYATTLRNLNDKLQSMENNINQLNKAIDNGISDIQVIDKIKINFKQENNSVVDALKDLIEFSDKNSYIYLGDLGNSENNFDEIYDEMLSKIAELLREISSSKKNKIDLYDLTSIKFLIEENGDSHDIITLSDIGSNGTGILVRTIIYISLLEIVSKKARIDENQVFHCILDEIGQISANYFSELLLFTEKNRFVFLNGMPVVADDIVALYPTVYTGATEGKKSFMYETSITQ